MYAHAIVESHKCTQAAGGLLLVGFPFRQNGQKMLPVPNGEAIIQTYTLQRAFLLFCRGPVRVRIPPHLTWVSCAGE